MKIDGNHKIRTKTDVDRLRVNQFAKFKWRPPSLSELTPYYIQILTHLGSEASKNNAKKLIKLTGEI